MLLYIVTKVPNLQRKTTWMLDNNLIAMMFPLMWEHSYFCIFMYIGSILKLNKNNVGRMFEIKIGFHNANRTVKPKLSPVSLENMFAQGTAHEKKSKQWNKITNSVTIHLARDKVLLSIVEKMASGRWLKHWIPDMWIPPPCKPYPFVGPSKPV